MAHPPINPENSPTASTETPSPQTGSPGGTWWGKIPDLSDMTGLSTSERTLREMELARLHQAVYEAEAGLPSSTGLMVRV